MKNIKYSKEERLQIGKEIYTHSISLSEAANKYDINPYTARDYMREYRDINHLPPMDDGRDQLIIIQKKKRSKYEDLEDMAKSELIDEVIKARVEAERAKKGYFVEGDGQEKVFKNIKEMNSK